MNLGYKYGWYLHGVYSPGLAKDCFSLAKEYERIPKNIHVGFTDKKVQDRYGKFLEFIAPYKDNADMLEIAASIHYLSYYIKWDMEKVLDFVEHKKPRFTRAQCDEMRDRLEKYGVMPAC